jgi:uncharacterized membrane protein YfcA
MILSSFAAGLLSSMGFGGGSVLIIYLVNFLNIPQKQAQGINLIFFIPCAIISIISYKKQNLIDFGKVLPVTAFSLIGIIIGFITLDFIPTKLLSRFFAGALLIFGLSELFKKPQVGGGRGSGNHLR